jgi:hypothetical protein
MFAVKDGHETGMFNFITMNNGNLLLINGVVIMNTGEMLFLKSGDTIDMEGNITRKEPLDNAVAAKF